MSLPFLIGSKRLSAAGERDPAEARFGDSKQGATLDLLQLEDYQCRRLDRVVYVGIHSERGHRNEKGRSGTMRSTVKSKTLPSQGFCGLPTTSSTCVGTIVPAVRAPETKGPSKATPNQSPNCRASLTARQTRPSDARSGTLLSMRSLSVAKRILRIAGSGSCPM